MPKSATDVMHEIIFSAVVDAVGALKSLSNGVPNALLRDINAIHANATFADLPSELQASVTASVRAGFNRLLKEGYAISPSQTPSGPAPGRPASRPTRSNSSSGPPAKTPGGRAPSARSPRPDRALDRNPKPTRSR